MAASTNGLPSGSQQSSSDLSDPPEYSEFTEQEVAQFTAATMAPRTRSSSGQAKSTGDSTLSDKPSASNEPTAKENDKDDIAAEIEVATRSSRRRVPSKRAQVTLAAPASSATPAPKRAKTSAKNWTPEYVTQSNKSPLVNKDLRALLLHPGAWDVLGEDDKKELLALFPDSRHILNANTPDARPNILSLRNDDNFRHDTEEYVANLKAGIHDPNWLQDAWAAHEARAAGQFDEYYLRKLEIDWKTTIPDEMKPEHLRPAPPAEPKEEARSEHQTEASSSADELTKGEEAATDEARAGSIRVSVVEKDTTGPDEGNGTGGAAHNAEATDDDDVKDVVMAASTGGSADSVTEDLEKVSVANISATVDGNLDKAGTDACED